MSSSSCQPSAQFFSQENLQHCLHALIEGARGGESWTYAIFWQSSPSADGSSVLVWGDGYYKGEHKKTNRRTAAEQEHRKKVLRELNSLVSGHRTESVDEEVTDTEWFFLISMTQSFVIGVGYSGSGHVLVEPGLGYRVGLACSVGLRAGPSGIRVRAPDTCVHTVVEWRH